MLGSLQLPPRPSPSVESFPVLASSECRGPRPPRLEACSQMVVVPGPFCRQAGDIYQLFPLPFIGRMSFGMGSTPGRRHVTRKMGASRTMPPHQPSGNAGSDQCPSGILHSPGTTVLVSSDNSTVISYINREWGTCSHSLWRETEHVFQLVINLLISIPDPAHRVVAKP